MTCQAPDVLRGAADEVQPTVGASQNKSPTAKDVFSAYSDKVLAAIKTEGVLDSERKKDRSIKE